MSEDTIWRITKHFQTINPQKKILQYPFSHTGHPFQVHTFIKIPKLVFFWSRYCLSAYHLNFIPNVPLPEGGQVERWSRRTFLSRHPGTLTFGWGQEGATVVYKMWSEWERWVIPYYVIPTPNSVITCWSFRFLSFKKKSMEVSRSWNVGSFTFLKNEYRLSKGWSYDESWIIW